MENYYDTLGVKTDADDTTIKKAYHALAKKYHPDSFHNKNKPDANEKFKIIKNAYETLINEDLRKTYDKYMLKPSRSASLENEAHFKKSVQFYEKGRRLYKAKKFESSSRAFMTALSFDQNSALYCSWLGLTLSHISGRLNEAKKWCEKAIKLSPYNADYYVNMAIVYRDAGLTSLADRFFEKALKYDPDNSRAHSWLKKSKNQRQKTNVFKRLFKRKSK